VLQWRYPGSLLDGEEVNAVDTEEHNQIILVLQLSAAKYLMTACDAYLRQIQLSFLDDGSQSIVAEVIVAELAVATTAKKWQEKLIAAEMLADAIHDLVTNPYRLLSTRTPPTDALECYRPLEGNVCPHCEDPRHLVEAGRAFLLGGIEVCNTCYALEGEDPCPN
jgi:isochorismate hydrolase